ncbi:MAG: sugar transferase, partial [Paludibacter sp.]
TNEQSKILEIRPGITDYASIEYVSENTILGNAENPEKVYIEEIMPHKICLNMKYIENQTIKEYFRIILLTFWNIFKSNNN